MIKPMSGSNNTSSTQIIFMPVVALDLTMLRIAQIAMIKCNIPRIPSTAISKAAKPHAHRRQFRGRRSGICVPEDQC